MAEAAKGGWSRLALTACAKVSPSALASGTAWLSSSVTAASITPLASATPISRLAGSASRVTLFPPVSNVGGTLSREASLVHQPPRCAFGRPDCLLRPGNVLAGCRASPRNHCLCRGLLDRQPEAGCRGLSGANRRQSQP